MIDWIKRFLGFKVVDTWGPDEEDLDSQLTVTERILSAEVDYLRAELADSHARYERLVRRLRKFEERPATLIAQPVRENSDPIKLGKHKSLEVRRAELEGLSRKRHPEEVDREKYWRVKASEEEQKIVQELTSLEETLEEDNHAQ